MEKPIEKALNQLLDYSKQITVLTGAGVSAESGIPTFRGPEGYWKVGSQNYQPQEIATFSAFQQMPDEVWKWYIFRLGVCRTAEPNPGHQALVEMEKILGDRFTLITQNVDGLHIRAGNSIERTYQIHGNIEYMRCMAPCREAIIPISQKMPAISREEELPEKYWELLRCPDCGGQTRPHVLLWDEFYNEHHYRFHSALDIALKTDLLIIAGTTGATNLPNQIVSQVMATGGTVIDINIEKNIFSDMAQKSRNGFFWKSTSGSAFPQIVKVLKQK